MPRIRNWHDLVFYRPTSQTRYEHINGLFGDAIDWNLIETHWQDMMQVVLSIRAGKVLPSTYVCTGRSQTRGLTNRTVCTARYAPAAAVDALVWQDICEVLTTPSLITEALQRAHSGAWLPHVLQARRKTLMDTLAHLKRQQARVLDAYLGEVIAQEEFERKRRELQQTEIGLSEQLQQLEIQVRDRIAVTLLTTHVEGFAQRLQPTLNALDFVQRRQLVELLIDRVIVHDGNVEIRYAIPIGPKGENGPFCHLRKDYLSSDA